MTDMRSFEIQLSEQKAKSRELEENAEKARGLASVLEDMKTDLSRIEARERALAAHGDQPIEIPFEQYIQKYHTTIAFEPLRSVLTGKALAAEAAEKADYLRGQIAEHEAEIARLLGDGKRD